MAPNCKACTKELLEKCISKHPSYKALFEPMVAILAAWAFFLGIKNARSDRAECNGCTKLLKIELKRKSKIFRLVNEIIDPWFDWIIS
jgi:hypothetical protein